jgi:CheY-like chemotaxis protein
MPLSETAPSYRVLVVEDTPDQREIIRVSLRPMEVVTAVNGLDGLMKLERVEPDFIISDVMMPEMDGWEFIRRVRQRPGYEKTPVIYLTALSSRDDMKRGYETGADVYLTKPYDPLRLKRNLEVFTDRFKMMPRPKHFTLAEVETEEKRLAEMPRVPARSTAQTPRPDHDVDPFKAEAPKAVAPPPAPAPPSPRPAAPSPAKAPPRALPPRILVVTADAKLVQELRACVPAGRGEILVADDSPTSMDKTSRYRPDAILLHWQLPERHGPALAELYSESPDCKGRPLVVVSDKRLGGAESRQLEFLGVFDTMRRPLEAKAVAELLADINQVTNMEARRRRLPWEEVERLEAGGAGHEGDPAWQG